MLKTLVVLTGPTGVGKTAIALELALEKGAPIISCDSRQLYKEMPIGTSAPSPEQLAAVQHFFVGTRSIHDYYSAAQYEQEVLDLMDRVLFPRHDVLFLVGGSMLYIDAVCRGIDDMPTVDPEVREQLHRQLLQEGLTPLLETLKQVDPDYYAVVDHNNPKRIVHALEIYQMTGNPFSSFRLHQPKKRAFNILKICLNRERADLYARIDQRVTAMMEQGLLEEARQLYPYRHLNALNTVGYKELFAYLDGSCSLEEAVEKIRFNTHRYARKQLTWFRKDPAYHWFHAENKTGIKKWIDTGLQTAL